ncbi:autophagy-related protein 16 [Delphinella strobiligena]|nr:autophagy-related protein 16 [Delphinella strobiligena]
MADWISQYTAALEERDAREKANKSYIDAYTKLADRTAALEKAPPPPPSAAAAPTPSIAEPSTPTTGRYGFRAPGRVKSPATEPSATASPDVLARLREDLSSTQRSRVELQTQLNQRQAELATLNTQSKAAIRQTEVLSREKRDLERRLKDREEEVRQKQRLVETVHDEMAALSLELNMAEQKAGRIKAENDMLVRRWMDKMGEEAEKMNLDSQWH